MSKREKLIDLPVTFVDLKGDQQAPRIAAYEVDRSGRPVKKLGRQEGNVLKVDLTDAGSIALGPDVEDFKTLPKESVVRYRVAEKARLWRDQGLVLAPEIWSRFLFQFVCVSGTVRKCRPWFWDVLDDIRFTPMVELAQIARIKPITADLHPHIIFPFRCQPLCDGIVRVDGVQIDRDRRRHLAHVPLSTDARDASLRDAAGAVSDADVRGVVAAE